MKTKRPLTHALPDYRRSCFSTIEQIQPVDPLVKKMHSDHMTLFAQAEVIMPARCCKIKLLTHK